MNVKTAWDSALSRFLQGNRPETRPKPKRSKKKKALKQAVKQAVKQPNEGDEIPQ
jgi:hypothetical protein